MIWYQNDVDLAQACLSCSQLRHPLVIRPTVDQPGTSAIMPYANKYLGSAAREASQLRVCLLPFKAGQFSGWFKASIQ